MHPAIYILGTMVVFFALGFATCWALDTRARRAMFARLADQQWTIDSLRRDAEDNERAKGFWKSADVMAKN